MDIYLLRHGQSTSNERQLVCGAADYPLSAIGKAQAERVCRYLRNIPFTSIYSSPLSRALDSIAPLGESGRVSIVPELAELDTGEASHISVHELWDRELRYRYQGLNPGLRYPGGECLNDMLGRVGNWFSIAMAKWGEGDTVLISGHEGTVCGIIHWLLKIDITHYPTFLIGNCDHVHITINDEGQIRYRFIPLASLT